jgi:hypothetical protein
VPLPTELGTDGQRPFLITKRTPPAAEAVNKLLYCPLQMFRVVFNTVFIWEIDTDLWIWKVSRHTRAHRIPSGRG